MAITFLQAVNRTLVKLRESEVNTLASSSNYTKLIAAFVNEAKEEVETAWPWTSLRTVVTITSVSGQDTYSITGAGEELIIESVWDVTHASQVIGPSPNYFVDQQIILTNLSNPGLSIYCDILGMDSNGDPQIRFTPTPNESGWTWRVYGRKKQAYLNTATDDNTLIKLPWKPIVYGAYLKALSERGEDGGASYDEVSRQYSDALATSIGIDSRNNQINTDWYQE